MVKMHAAPSTFPVHPERRCAQRTGVEGPVSGNRGAHGCFDSAPAMRALRSARTDFTNAVRLVCRAPPDDQPDAGHGDLNAARPFDSGPPRPTFTRRHT